MPATCMNALALSFTEAAVEIPFHLQSYATALSLPTEAWIPSAQTRVYTSTHVPA